MLFPLSLSSSASNLFRGQGATTDIVKLNFSGVEWLNCLLGPVRYLVLTIVLLGFSYIFLSNKEGNKL